MRRYAILGLCCLGVLAVLGACSPSFPGSGTTAPESNSEGSGLSNDGGTELCTCAQDIGELSFSTVRSGSVETGGVGLAVRAVADKMPFAESAYAGGIAVTGKIEISYDFCISEPVPAELYCQFLNDTLPQSMEYVVHIDPRRQVVLDYASVVFDDESGRFVVPPEQAGGPTSTATFVGAVAFVEWLSDQSGCEFRLPTEAEWILASARFDWSKGPGHAGLGNWTLDFWSPSIAAIVDKVDPTGPAQFDPDADYGWDNPRRVLRRVDGRGPPPRVGATERQPLPHAIYGLRVVSMTTE